MSTTSELAVSFEIGEHPADSFVDAPPGLKLQNSNCAGGQCEFLREAG